jgi:hypothetical protein
MAGYRRRRRGLSQNGPDASRSGGPASGPCDVWSGSPPDEP